jgi:hypothetical protein
VISAVCFVTADALDYKLGGGIAANSSGVVRTDINWAMIRSVIITRRL